MNMMSSYNYFAMVLLVLFFWPYVHKLTQVGLIGVLLPRLPMPLDDLLSTQEAKAKEGEEKK